MTPLRHLKLLLLLLFPYLVYGGSGTWSKRYGLGQIPVGVNLGIQEATRTGEDTRDVNKQRALVYLDYTRKNHTDQSVTHEWHLWVTYRLVGDPTSRVLRITYEHGNYVYTDYEELSLAVGATGYQIIVDKVEGEYSLNQGSTWTYVATPSGSSYFPTDIDLRLELRTERVYAMSPTLVQDQPALSFTPSTYQVKWSFIEGAEEYDLEWVFIDSQSDAAVELAALFANPAQLALNPGRAFQLKEPTRVRVWGTQYILDKAYPTGTLYFRVRSVGRFTSSGSTLDDIKLGEWSYYKNPSNFGGGLDATDMVYYSIGTDFEPNKNWLYGVSFADDGKSVSSISYYDGSNRGRQSITYSTSDDVSLVGETKFDKEGRQSLSIAPAPVRGRQLGYRPNFNLAADGYAFNEGDFDYDYVFNSAGVTSDAILPLNSPASGSSGAAQYFSKNNQFTDDLYRGAIPDAGGYVFSQTIYRNDGTGRIERVGGMGADFQATGSHAVQTFYGSPTTVELKRLFGANVADSPSGYRKEVVRDANGQYSATYYDKRGNVIATSLLGTSPTSLRPIEQDAAEVVTTNLLANNQVQGTSLISETTFLNGVENNSVSLQYNITGLVNQLTTQPVTIGSQTVNFGSLCSTCRYDLQIEILNPDNTVLTNYTSDIDPALDCVVGSSANAAGLSHTITTTFPYIGEYRIIKRLSVDIASMQTSFTNSLTTLGLDDPSTFVNEYLNYVDLSGCFDDCEDYCTALKKLAYIQDHPGTTAAQADTYWAGLTDAQKATELANCIGTVCNPDEQNEDFEGDGELPDINPMDVVCDGSHAQMISQISPGGVFYDNLLSTFWSTVSANLSSFNSAHSTSYTLAQLQDPTQYTSALAEWLLVYHREYCHLSYCSDWAASLNYSNSLHMSMQSQSWGSSFFTNLMGSGNADPFTASVFNSSATPNLSSRLSTYLTDHQSDFTGGCTPPTSGNLVAYVNALAACLYNNDVANGTVQSTAYYESLKREMFLGVYNMEKENMIKNYKLAHGCVFYTDDNAVFHGPQSQSDMLSEITSGMSGVLNPSQCSLNAFENTQNWIAQLPYQCRYDLTTASLYNSSYTEASLAASTGSQIQDLFYDYSVLSCPQNTYGWFFNPDADDTSPDPTVPSESQYDAIMTMLSGTCGLSAADLPFLVDPAPVSTTIALTNQTFSDCFDGYVAMINYGLSQLNAGSGVVSCTVGSAPPPGYTCQEKQVSLSSYPALSGCSLTGTFKLGRGIETSPSGVQHYYTNIIGQDNGSCGLKLYCDGSIRTNYLVSISNPTKYVNYPTIYGPVSSMNAIVFDALYSDGTHGIAYFIEIEASGCTDLHVGDFTDMVITDFGNIGDIALPDYQQDCIDATLGQASVDATNIYNDLLNDLQGQALDAMDNCLSSAAETFKMTYTLKEYQYTLYYYDLVNNLVQTVPPQGVRVLSMANITNADPGHQMETRYQYNGLNSLIASYTPDGGKSVMYLDKLYRVRYSQTSQQAYAGNASYSRYDGLGRVTEAGEFKTAGVDLSTKTEDNTYPSSGIMDYTHTFYEDVYGIPANLGGTGAPYPSTYTPTADASLTALFGTAGQENLRNSIGAVMNRQAEYDGSGAVIAGTEVIGVLSYSYDPHKNVKKMVSTNSQLAFINKQHNVVDYKYDLVSGNTEEVIYQDNSADEYHHRYIYDANNRLVHALTSHNGDNWEKDAKYFYYLHGSLARQELGDDKVQGTDYAYNLQGWLKGVNSSTLDRTRDIGTDAVATSINKYSGMDVFGYQLGYFTGDYKAIRDAAESPSNPLNDYFAGTSDVTAFNTNPDMSGAAMGSLYNGNITHMVTALRDNNENKLDILANNYQYDQLQRIRQVQVYTATNLQTNNSFFGAALFRGVSGESAYQESYTFDKNGNLKTMKRNGSGWKDLDGDGVYEPGNTPTESTALAMDNFAYYYNIQSGGTPVTNPTDMNRLSYVLDNVAAANYTGDIDPTQAANNYVYNKAGQLTADVQENITNIDWTVTGKVKKISFVSTSGKHNMKFIYDPMDRRVVKMEYFASDKSWIKYTYYTYDAGGNVMATYDRTKKLTSASKSNNYSDLYVIGDHSIYGSGRIGVENENVTLVSKTYSQPSLNNTTDVELAANWTETNLIPLVFPTYTDNKVGDKSFELSNHLGNVLAVVTDRKLGKTDNSLLVYVADVINFTDYSPYGTQLDNRHQIQVNTDEYRYGFQDQEADDEIKGEGNSYNYEYRMNDPRLGRFFACDPLTAKYSWYTPYQFSGNKVISCVELEGLEEKELSESQYNKEKSSAFMGEHYEGTTYYKYYQLHPGGQMGALTGTENVSIPRGADVVTVQMPGISGVTNGAYMGVLSFTTYYGETYSWNNTARWYTNKKGQTWNDPWNVDLFNGGGTIAAGGMNFLLGDGYKRMTNEVENEYDGDYIGYFVDKTVQGLWNTGADIWYGGHRANNAWIGLWATTPMTAYPGLYTGLRYSALFTQGLYRWGKAGLYGELSFVSTQSWVWRGSQTTFGFGIRNTTTNAMIRFERHSFNLSNQSTARVTYTTHLNFQNIANVPNHIFFNPYKMLNFGRSAFPK